MLAHTDRAHTGATATVGDGEGLMKVEVADVASHVARRRDAHECVHVGAVNVDLGAAAVDDVSGLLDGLVKDAVGGWLGDHGAGHVALGHLRLQVADVDLSVGERLHAADLEAAHGGRREVGAVGRRRDQTDVAVALPSGLLLLADGHEPSLLSV